MGKEIFEMGSHPL